MYFPTGRFFKNEVTSLNENPVCKSIQKESASGMHLINQISLPWLWQKNNVFSADSMTFSKKEDNDGISHRFKTKVALIIGTLAFSAIFYPYWNQNVEIQENVTRHDNADSGIQKIFRNNVPLIERSDIEIPIHTNSINENRIGNSSMKVEELATNDSNNFFGEGLKLVGKTILACGLLWAVRHCFNESNSVFFKKIKHRERPEKEQELTLTKDELASEEMLSAPPITSDTEASKTMAEKIKRKASSEPLTSSVEKVEQTVYEKLEKNLADANEDDLLVKYKCKEIFKTLTKEKLEEAKLSASNILENWFDTFNPTELSSKERNACVAAMFGEKESMEDTYILSIPILPIKVNGVTKQVEVDLVGIFDGHAGKACADFLEKNVENFLKEGLPTILNIEDELKRDEALFDYLKNFFVEINRKYQVQIVDPSFKEWLVWKACPEDEKENLEEPSVWKAGSTAIITLLIDGKLCTANVGDSRAVVSFSENGESRVIALSEDADPNREKYGKKFKKGEISDGAIIVHKVQNSDSPCKIGMARAVGYSETSSITAEAEITCYDLNKMKSKERFLIMASDGLWDAMSSLEASRFLQEKLKETSDCKELAIALRDEAYKRLSQDNITVIVCDLSKEKQFMDYLSQNLCRIS